MYKNAIYGNNTNASHDVRTLNVALSRMSAIAAVSLLIPGPKMIWHFSELGYNDSIFTCNNGSVNTSSDAISGDCKLDTKPQLQWTNNWLGDTNRSAIYNNYAKIIDLKKNNPVFSKDYTINSGTTLQPKIYIYDTAASAATLKNVVVLSNFNVITTNVTPNFPYTGTWYNLMDNTQITVNNTTDPISIEAGGFRVYGNQPANLSTENLNSLTSITLSPNPSTDFFSINYDLAKVNIYAITGQLMKSFQNKSKTDLYEISDLNNGLYLVKVFDINNNEKTFKLIKQ
jgi:hypothetical protein